MFEVLCVERGGRRRRGFESRRGNGWIGLYGIRGVYEEVLW